MAEKRVSKRSRRERGRRNRAKRTARMPGGPGVPFPDDLWCEIAKELRLPPQLQRVVELLLSGKENQEIADAMQIQLTTFRTYLARIFERTGANSRLQVVLHVVSLANELGVWSIRPSLDTSLQNKGKASNGRLYKDVIK
ncbi:MAG TPA: helix-turn-helix transcriptional regulator [Pirellulaceae bacterium]|nr:helix-turn-helix transcriptional regulator [Pirellulaceae bacterium]